MKIDTSKLVKTTLVKGEVTMERLHPSREPINIAVTPIAGGAHLKFTIEDRPFSRRSMQFSLTKEELGEFAKFFSDLQNAV